MRIAVVPVDFTEMTSISVPERIPERSVIIIYLRYCNYAHI